MDKTEKEKRLPHRKFHNLTILQYLMGGGVMVILLGVLIYRISAKYLNSNTATVIYLVVGGAMLVYAVYIGWMLNGWLWAILGVLVFGFAVWFGKVFAIEYDKKPDTNEVWSKEDMTEFYASTSQHDNDDKDSKHGRGDINW